MSRDKGGSHPRGPSRSTPAHRHGSQQPRSRVAQALPLIDDHALPALLPRAGKARSAAPGRSEDKPVQMVVMPHRSAGRPVMWPNEPSSFLARARIIS